MRSLVLDILYPLYVLYDDGNVLLKISRDILMVLLEVNKGKEII